MQIATGTVVGGKVIVEGDPLPEGAVVTILAREADETFEVPRELEAELQEFIEAFQPLPLPVEAGQAYGRIKANLRAKGRIIGENDLWIASHAFAEDYILVTNNTREFKRIKGLKLENWAA